MVYAEVENDEELMYSYQLVDDNDRGGYGVWVSTGPLSGYYAERGIEEFEDALGIFFDVVKHKEFC